MLRRELRDEPLRAVRQSATATGPLPVGWIAAKRRNPTYAASNPATSERTGLGSGQLYKSRGRPDLDER